MVKIFGFAALAAVAALVLGFGSQIGSSAPKAHADTTGIVVIGCEFIAGSVDGDQTDTLASGDVLAACDPSITNLPATGAISIEALADAIGDEDGVLEASDFADIEGYDGNQISTECTAAGTTTTDFYLGNACTLVVFVFTDNEATVQFDVQNGLTQTQKNVGENDWTCDANAEEEDCNNSVANDGDGVVVNGILEENASRGDTKTITVTQGVVDQTAEINVVGPPNDVKLTLAETTIESNHSTANVDDCVDDTDVTEAIAPPTSTLAVAKVVDQDDTELARIPVDFSIDPPAAVTTIAELGDNNPSEDVTGNTYFTLVPVTSGAPTASYRTVCGGRNTGEADIIATINLTPTTEDHSTDTLTVGGVPSAAALTAQPSQIKCDGTETAVVTAKVTDSAGNNVADGVPVTFTVVALGTANPINTETKDGSASSTITPLSNSAAGVTVIVTAGDFDIADPYQTSIRVDCALPLVTQPTLAPAASPTAGTGVITVSDTGNGGYLGQSDSSFPMWTLVALALGSFVLVAGGMVTRRAGK